MTQRYIDQIPCEIKYFTIPKAHNHSFKKEGHTHKSTQGYTDMPKEWLTLLAASLERSKTNWV